MEPTTVEVIPGLRTEMWGYNGLVPGPTFQIAQGRRTVVRQINNLPAVHPVLQYTPWTSVHLHGSASLPEYDGYASDITNPGQYKDYHYPNWQPARTLWYHDHGVHHTAENVFMGLAGQYQLTDPLERSLPIPHGEYDVPLIVSDKMFNSDGSLLFSTNDNAGFYGDVILVNGRPWPVMKVKRRKYRFRILNASPSRSYNWSLDSGDTMAVIATDAGLMPTPQYVRSFRHGVAERYEVVIDFAKYRPGQRIVLRNASPKNNINFTNTNKIMAFDVVADAFSTVDNAVPASLNPGQATMLLKESDAVKTRTLNFIREHGQWTINGTTWEDIVRSGFTKVIAGPKIDDVEIWELRNPSGGWHHPAHIHFIDFRVLSRNGRPALPHELGAKDVVFLGENESVRLLIKFDQGRGKYMVHCHNLVHEDHDMMTQFEIRDDTTPADDPFSDPARWLPEGPL
ncbi:MAG: multicopper oxidase family protein [Dermatophilaceae bacterium]|nr:multicopper oxidase family protein [Dermatophilaceae bacterium]